MVELILPLECGGCGAPATRWCGCCAAELAVRPDRPHLICPRTDPGVPVFALGRYAGMRRRAIVAVKEHGRTDLVAPLGAALAAGVQHLLAWRVVAAPVVLVPAPTRWLAARRRGGDPVTRMAAAAAAHPAVAVIPALRMAAWVRDSVGLGAAARQRNIAGRVVLRRRRLAELAAAAEVLLVDDIVTTGATARESVRVLQSAGARVAGV
ncbi:MAG TPA: ComF family protein, partial [Mycobacterium sp.]|nr:ComF family protein [Mycobacterium sp.]